MFYVYRVPFNVFEEKFAKLEENSIINNDETSKRLNG
jgi:hypothetical protein